MITHQEIIQKLFAWSENCYEQHWHVKKFLKVHSKIDRFFKMENSVSDIQIPNCSRLVPTHLHESGYSQATFPPRPILKHSFPTFKMVGKVITNIMIPLRHQVLTAFQWWLRRTANQNFYLCYLIFVSSGIMFSRLLEILVCGPLF